MSDDSGFYGVESAGSGDVGRVLAGVQTSLIPAFEEIQMWVSRLRDGDGGLLEFDEVLSGIESAVAACDGQLALLDGVS